MADPIPPARLADERQAALRSVLEDARAAGFLGPGPVGTHLALALAMVEGVGAARPSRAVDLGSGGGVPGLVLAEVLPGSSWVLLDSQQRRTEFLAEAVKRLGLEARVRVLRTRAEDAGQDPEFRGQGDLVVARSFGPPAVTAECGAPLLKVDGLLVVAEPPDWQPDRWPAAGLDQLGLVVERRGPGPGAWVALRLVRPCPGRFPRRVGIPAKRPLFGRVQAARVRRLR